jgi:dethiobiotin synthetase
VSLTVIETAGGVFSPLSATTSNYDLALRLEPATWVLLAPNRLGVLHDALATLQAMDARGRYPDRLVLHAPVESDTSTPTNARLLERWGLKCPITQIGWDDQIAVRKLFERLVTASS